MLYPQEGERRFAQESFAYKYKPGQENYGFYHHNENPWWNLLGWEKVKNRCAHVTIDGYFADLPLMPDSLVILSFDGATEILRLCNSPHKDFEQISSFAVRIYFKYMAPVLSEWIPLP